MEGVRGVGEQAVERYCDAVRLWRVEGGRRAPDLVAAAVGCLEADVAPVSVCELAGERVDAYAPTRDDLEPLVRATLDDLGRAALWEEDAADAALDVAARRVVGGRVRPRDLAEWAMCVLGWGGAGRARPFVELAECYDELDVSEMGHTAAGLDAAVRADMDLVRAFYADKTGIRPGNATGPRLRDEEKGFGAGA